MRHQNAAGGIFAVAPQRSVFPRFLIPPSDPQARNFSSGFFQMNLFNYRDAARTGSIDLFPPPVPPFGIVSLGSIRSVIDHVPKNALKSFCISGAGCPAFASEVSLSDSDGAGVDPFC
jgi:hypothetical protein